MRFAVIYEEDLAPEAHTEQLDHGNFFRFACEELAQAEEWAREAVKEGPHNKSRATIYDCTRPSMKYINIDGEPVRIEIPLQARVSSEMQSVK